MKRVVIVRHAKAVPYGYDDDFSRDLRDSGVRDANLVSGELEKRDVYPDKIVSSPALRAKRTASLFAENLNYDLNNIQFVEDIYHGMTTGEFLEFLQGLPDQANTVFFFGHNPDFHYFVNNLLEQPVGEMPTCSTVGIDFKCSHWNDVEARSGKNAFHLIPKFYR